MTPAQFQQLLITRAPDMPGITAAARRDTQGAGRSPGQAGAVFVQTDAVSGNAVAVYDRAADGTLRAAGTCQTGDSARFWAGRWWTT